MQQLRQTSQTHENLDNKVVNIFVQLQFVRECSVVGNRTWRKPQGPSLNHSKHGIRRKRQSTS